MKISYDTTLMKNLVKQIRGISYKKTDLAPEPLNGYSPVLRANNIQNGELTGVDLVYVNDSKIKDYQMIRKGDIVIAASSGSINIVGKAAQSTRNMDVSFGAFCKVVRPLEIVDSRYVGYYFQSPYYRHTISSLANGANINNIKNEHIDSLVIPLPPLQSQKRIVEVLDKAQELIDLRKKQIELLDELIQSVFYDMFGDPVTNPKGWEKISLRDCINIVGGYAFKSKEFVESGIPIIKIGTANKGYFDTSTFSFWSKNYDSKLEKYKVVPGDLLITLTGTVGKDDYGNICVANDSYNEYLLNQRVAKLDVICEMNRTFIQYCFAQKKFKGELIKLSRGVRQANISNKDIYSLEIINPDIYFQNQFAQKVQKIEEQKQLMQQSLTEMENNFNSLMQRAFKGELFN